jgi:hypothetical protein
MAKRKSPQELMAERNPLGRTAVAPVDIYSEPAEQSKPVKTAHNSSQAAKKGPVKAVSKETRPYSTYLTNDQVKGIKLRAVNSGQKDQHIVQAAVDEYFERHQLG